MLFKFGLTVFAAAWLSACHGLDGAGPPNPYSGPSDVLYKPFYPDAGCPVVIDQPPLLDPIHVAEGSEIQWNSNPPSSGEHYPIWAAYQEYASPVPRGYYVHNLEHGAVVLLYNCEDAGCPDVVAALREVSAAIPDDSSVCVAQQTGVRARVLLTPDPLLAVPVAAAAWGWTYQAQCADLPTLTQFALDHYGQGREAICGNGTTIFH